jgi:hypothetical protein
MNLSDIIIKSAIELQANNGSKEYVNGISGSKDWEDRIELVKKCPDNIFIPRDKKAGTIEDDVFYMHNGIKINLKSYYGYSMLRMLFENKGVHEPQEEKAFLEVLNYIEKGSTMIELGSYWGFYSLWFNKKTNGKNILVEPILENMNYGIENFKLNETEAIFYNKYISSSSSHNTLTLEEIFLLENIERLSVCHSDIQGEELEMLKGGVGILDKIDYFFISTHSNNIHYECLDFLEKRGFITLCSCDLNESYSYDGLIVSRNLKIKGPDKIEISKR